MCLWAVICSLSRQLCQCGVTSLRPQQLSCCILQNEHGFRKAVCIFDILTYLKYHWLCYIIFFFPDSYCSTGFVLHLQSNRHFMVFSVSVFFLISHFLSWWSSSQSRKLAPLYQILYYRCFAVELWYLYLCLYLLMPVYLGTTGPHRCENAFTCTFSGLSLWLCYLCAVSSLTFSGLSSALSQTPLCPL